MGMASIGARAPALERQKVGALPPRREQLARIDPLWQLTPTCGH